MPITQKSLVLAAPDRVWTALTNTGQLAIWFGAEFRAPLVPGARVVGRLIPTKVLLPVARRRKAYTGLPLKLDVQQTEPPRLLAFRWSPFAFFNPDVKAVATSLIVIEVAPDPRGSRLSTPEDLAARHRDRNALSKKVANTFRRGDVI